MPDVHGMDQATAEATLAALGLAPTSNQQSTTDKSQNGVVLIQDPVAGTVLDKGSPVGLAVGVYSGPVYATCKYCGGTGYIDTIVYWPTRITCPTCGGGPPRIIGCPTCGGGGSIEGPQVEEPRRVVCGNCNGTGQVQAGVPTQAELENTDHPAP